MLIPPVRDGGQAQYIDEPLPDTVRAPQPRDALRGGASERGNHRGDSRALASMSPRNFAPQLQKVRGRDPPLPGSVS